MPITSAVLQEMIADLEKELCFLFSVDPSSVVLVLQSNPFCRLMLHGISQYVGLHSTTVHSGNDSVMVVECGHGKFLPPDNLLMSHLQQ